MENAFKLLYLHTEGDNPRRNAIQIAGKLIALFGDCESVLVDSWGGVVAKLIKDEELSSDVIKVSTHLFGSEIAFL